MAMITIRVSDDEKKWLNEMAELHGITLSELMMKYSITELEDEYDEMTAQFAHKRWLEQNKKSEPISKVIKDMGFDK